MIHLKVLKIRKLRIVYIKNLLLTVLIKKLSQILVNFAMVIEQLTIEFIYHRLRTYVVAKLSATQLLIDRPLTQYVIQGLREVFKARPKLQYRMTVHSDQGIQYQSNAYRHELRKHNIFQSMSRRATCHDNAAMESFFHTMKVEIDYYTHHFKTKKELIKRMESWIKYYNQERIRHTKKSLTPIEYRNQALKEFI